MKEPYCCQKMKYFAEYQCPDHPDRFDCPDCILYAEPKKQLYGIIIHDGGSSFIGIDYCPWCGKRLTK